MMSSNEFIIFEYLREILNKNLSVDIYEEIDREFLIYSVFCDQMLKDLRKNDDNE
jgi:hypothetical protein